MNYSNIPVDASPDQGNQTLQAINNFYSQPLELNSTVLAAMKGYFTNRGFGEVSAESITLTIMTQAKQDGYNPMQILDTLKGISNTELSGLVAEILNYNRFKTSSLGYAQPIKPNTEIQRNILDNSANSSPLFSYILRDENNEQLTDEFGEILLTE